MQQAIPSNSGRAWAPHSPSSPSSCSTVTTNNSGGGDGGGGGSSCSDGDNLKRLIAENPVLVLGRRGCCMCHVMKRLLLGLGVNPSVCEVGDEVDEAVLMKELTVEERVRVQNQMLFPAVFIGGRLVGGLDRLMAVHISGDLVPILKDAGALWL